MDKLRPEISQVDQNSPEFKKALEAATQEILANKSTEKIAKPSEAEATPKPDSVLGGFGSEHPDVKKSVALDSTAVSPDVHASILNRTLEILQGDSSFTQEEAHDVMDALMGKDDSAAS